MQLQGANEVHSRHLSSGLTSSRDWSYSLISDQRLTSQHVVS